MEKDYSDYFKLLNLPYVANIVMGPVEVINNVKHVFLSTKDLPTFCPECGARMHSKGLKERTVIHPIYQDGTYVILHVKQRRWECTECDFSENEQLPFIQKYKHYTTITPLLILEAMKDLNRSTKSIADQYHVSDTEVHDIFSSYVDLKRLPLPEYISIDEVHLDIDDESKYAFVIMDFVTGEIVDIVHNRWKETLYKYFSDIPYDERLNVKAVISDAYDTYQRLCDDFFPNAVSILDSFHVVSFIITRLNNYINSVQKKYRDIQNKELEKKNMETNKDNKTIKDLPERFIFAYDTGDGWDFDCKIYKTIVIKEIENDEHIPAGFVLDAKGMGIWEDNIMSLYAYLEGKIDKDFDGEDEEIGIYKPWNFDIEKYSEFDDPVDIEELNDIAMNFYPTLDGKIY